jgi:hypothetical protein
MILSHMTGIGDSSVEAEGDSLRICLEVLIRCEDTERGFKDIEKTVPKDLVREYDTPQGGKVREVGIWIFNDC